MRNMKIGSKLLLMLLLASLIPIVFVSALSLFTMRSLSERSLYANTQLGARTSVDSETALLEMAEEYLQKIAREQSLKTDLTQQRVQSELLAMADYMAALYRDAGSAYGKDLPLPDRTEDGVFSSKYMLAPGVSPTWQIQEEVRLLGNAETMLRPLHNASGMMSNVYLGTPSGISYRFSASNAYDESYDSRLRPWYLQAVLAAGKPVWTQTYVDSYGIVCATNAVAYFSDEGRLLGVIATDVTLEQMQKDIKETKIGQTGYAFLMDQEGNMIVHPKMTGAVADSSLLDGQLSPFSGESGLVRAALDGAQSYIAYHRLPVTGWYMAVVAEVEEIVRPSVVIGEQIATYLEESRQSIHAAMWSVAVQFIVVIAAATLVVIVVASFLTKNITSPIQALLHTVEEIGGGNLNIQARADGTDEIAGLARAFNSMTHKLRQRMEQIAEFAADRQRTNSELQVAARIQSGMVPAEMPVLPQSCRFDVCASLQMAKQVGGDFYDYFLLNPTQLCVCIADVSGKGVPAALFMARAKAQVQSCVLSHETLAQAVEAANSLLTENNDESMFVTLFAAVLNLETGELTYVNAGHNPPLLKRRNRTFEWMKLKKSMVLAGLPGTRYPSQTIKLKKGERILLYTDGVTEAMNGHRELYGEKRLLEAVNDVREDRLSELLAHVRDGISQFAAGAPQADDITLLAVEWR